MAISRSSKKVQRIEVFPAHDSSAADDANAKYPIINVFYDSTLAGTGADSDVDGIVAGTSVFLTKFVEDGGAATDVSGQDALVQSVCTALWS